MAHHLVEFCQASLKKKDEDAKINFIDQKNIDDDCDTDGTLMI